MRIRITIDTNVEDDAYRDDIREIVRRIVPDVTGTQASWAIIGDDNNPIAPSQYPKDRPRPKLRVAK